MGSAVTEPNVALVIRPLRGHTLFHPLERVYGWVYSHYSFQSLRKKMNNQPLSKVEITTAVVADSCFGIACPLRCTCSLYAAVEGEHVKTIESCAMDGEFPLYKQIETKC
jgi:hypothetical protein